jgi:predicted phosphoadenosine phosphosulfate sulfurtransferase
LRPSNTGPFSLSTAFRIRFFSSVNYRIAVIHCLNNLKRTVFLSQGKMSLSDYREQTTFKFADFIYSRTHVPSYCDMSFCMLNPSFFCHKINFVYYKGQGLQTIGNQVLHQ